MRGTSNAPLILGIVGSILMLPALACAMVCGAAADAVQETTSGNANGVWTAISVFFALPIVTGIVGGIKGKSNPNLSFVLLLISAIFALLGWIVSAFTNIYALAPLILFVIGAIIAKVQKMEE